ncbi:hypothetical protein [Clostridium sp.]|uniref:hypothetical protein n=1 Tax=Clostridium sp. TaxID=1506 RepID=UPI002FCACD03
MLNVEVAASFLGVKTQDTDVHKAEQFFYTEELPLAEAYRLETYKMLLKLK